MVEYIEREALIAVVDEWSLSIEDFDCLVNDLNRVPAADVVERSSFDAVAEKYAQIQDKLLNGELVPVVHGEWLLTVHSFYYDTFDESCELCVYIVAHCSECFGKHPNSYQVYSKTLCAPEDADEDFRFDQKAEEDKALAEFNKRGYTFANFCPNCGSRMDGGNNG